MVPADAHGIVIRGQERIHGRHGAHPQHLKLRVFVVGDGDQRHGDGGAVAALGAVVRVAQTVTVKVLFHVGPAVDATDTAFHVGRGGPVIPFHCHDRGRSQFRHGLEERLGVYIDPEPRFLAQEDDKSVSGVVEPVAPGHGLDG